MIALNELNSIKTFVEIQAKTERTRPIYLITEGDKIIWKNSSDFFQIDAFSVGARFVNSKGEAYDLSSKKVITEPVPRIVYGMRLLINIVPIVNESNDAVGAFVIINPRLHPTASAFYDYAPILTEMYPNGAIFFVTNLFECSHRHASSTFDLPIFGMHESVREGDPAHKTIQARQPLTFEFDASKYGVPVFIACHPLFAEDGKTIVGVFGIVLPKKLAVDLRTMSQNLENSLSQVSSAIEQLAASASQIHENEQTLNAGIRGIHHHSNEINNISHFIKKVADETKMLGLNAAIEAARAGQAGKGFGVVADEIRKLSEQSNGAVPQIEELTSRIRNNVDKSVSMSDSSLLASQEQAAASQEITASIQEITSMTVELHKIADQL